MINKVFEKLEKYDLFSDFQYGFRSSRSTAYLLTVVLIELLGFLTGLGLLELWHLIYPRLLTEFGMLAFFTNLKVVSATFVLVCFLIVNESTCQTRKKNFISLQKLFSFSRKSNFRILYFQIL